MFKFKLDRVPLKISPCPIKEAVAELRFSDNFPLEVAVGMIYNSLINNGQFTCSIPIRLPINDVPINLRINDHNLKYQPHYIIDIGKNMAVRLSLNSIAVSINGAYVGWSQYYNYISGVIDIFQKLQIIKQLERVGLRYTSFFQENISKGINVSLNIADNEFSQAKNYIRSEWLYDHDITCNLQVSNNVTLNINEMNLIGSLIDVDIATANNEIDINVAKSLFTKFHDIEKQIFFSVLKPDFLTSLNPEYAK